MHFRRNRPRRVAINHFPSNAPNRSLGNRGSSWLGSGRVAQAERNRLASWEDWDHPYPAEFDFEYYDSFFWEDDYPTDCVERFSYRIGERTLRRNLPSLFAGTPLSV